MEETFSITVYYNNQERDFDVTFQLFGYTHKIAIVVDGTPILFEPDEERNYRASLPFGETTKIEIDIFLLQAIAIRLEEVFNISYILFKYSIYQYTVPVYPLMKKPCIF